MKRRSSIIKAATAVVLVAALAIPAYAFGVPGNGKGGPKVNTHANATAAAKQVARMAAKKAALTARIDKVLANRGRAFENAAGKIESRITSVTAMAASVEASGGNIADVTTALNAATTDLAAARAAEAAAADLFRAVPNATDRRAAFKAAMAKAREARKLLNESRSHLLDAMRKLEGIAAALQTVSETPAVATS